MLECWLTFGSKFDVYIGGCWFGNYVIFWFKNWRSDYSYWSFLAKIPISLFIWAIDYSFLETRMISWSVYLLSWIAKFSTSFYRLLTFNCKDDYVSTTFWLSVFISFWTILENYSWLLSSPAKSTSSLFFIFATTLSKSFFI